MSNTSGEEAHALLTALADLQRRYEGRTSNDDEWRTVRRCMLELARLNPGMFIGSGGGRASTSAIWYTQQLLREFGLFALAWLDERWFSGLPFTPADAEGFGARPHNF